MAGALRTPLAETDLTSAEQAFLMSEAGEAVRQNIAVLIQALREKMQNTKGATLHFILGLGPRVKQCNVPSIIVLCIKELQKVFAGKKIHLSVRHVEDHSEIAPELSETMSEAAMASRTTNGGPLLSKNPKAS